MSDAEPCGARRPCTAGAGLVDGVTCLALLADLLAVLGDVAVVVTAETPGGIDVSDVVRIATKRHLHVRKHVPLKHTLDAEHGSVKVLRPDRRGRRWPGAVKIVQQTGNLGQPRLFRRIAALQRLDRLPAEERQARGECRLAPSPR